MQKINIAYIIQLSEYKGGTIFKLRGASSAITSKDTFKTVSDRIDAAEKANRSFILIQE